MSRYIGKYVSMSDMCLRTKSIRQLLTRELHPLPIPNGPWDTISVDFIMELPESNGKDAIMVIVDSDQREPLCQYSHYFDGHQDFAALSLTRLETSWFTQKSSIG